MLISASARPDGRLWLCCQAAALVLALALDLTATQVASRYARAGVTDDRLVEQFVADLQRAVARNNRQAVAAMIQYPIVVIAAGFRLPIQDETEFVRQYEAIFTPALKAMLAETGVGRDPGRRKYEVTAFPDGLVMGPNAIWFKPAGDGRLRITAIAVPSPTVESEREVAASRRDAAGRTPATAIRPEPRRILFRAGPRVARLSGALLPDQFDSYLVWAQQGQLLELRILGVQGRAVVARAFDARTGALLDGRLREGVRAWSGRVSATGDCRIEVTRAASAGSSISVRYNLHVALR